MSTSRLLAAEVLIEVKSKKGERMSDEKQSDNIEVERRFLEQLRYGASVRVPVEALEGIHDVDFKAFVDHTLDSLQVALLASLWTDHEKKVLVYTHPADWWQAVKSRFAPAWFRRRYPVRVRTVTIYVRAVYPKLKLDAPPGTRTATFIYGRSSGLAEPKFAHRIDYQDIDQEEGVRCAT